MDAATATASRPRVRVPLRGEARLVARLRAGDARAFEELYERHHRGLLAFCRHLLGSREEAEDAVQHTFLAAHRALRAGDDRELRLTPWLYAIARNRCLSVLRARRDAVPLETDPVALDGLHAQVARRAELQELVADVQQLPEDQRAALVLFELGDLPHDEIAQVLGVRREKVKALVFQARETLMAGRKARELPCDEVREQLATLRGSALRRAPLRRHVATCAGCAEYEAEVRRQRAALALVLPVAPTAALKAGVLGGAAAGGAGLAATGGGVGAALSGKALAIIAAAGVAGGAGYTGVERFGGDPPRAVAGDRPPATAQVSQGTRSFPVIDVDPPPMTAAERAEERRRIAAWQRLLAKVAPPAAVAAAGAGGPAAPAKAAATDAREDREARKADKRAEKAQRKADKQAEKAQRKADKRAEQRKRRAEKAERKAAKAEAKRERRAARRAAKDARAAKAKAAARPRRAAAPKAPKAAKPAAAAREPARGAKGPKPPKPVQDAADGVTDALERAPKPAKPDAK